MFKPDFSFLPSAPHSSSTPTSTEYSSRNISPNTSRSPSPHHPRDIGRQASSSSRRLSQRDTRYDTYRGRQPSISALTAQLRSHAISSEPTSSLSSVSSGGAPSSSDVSIEPDEGIFDSPDTPGSTATDYSSNEDFEPGFWDLTMTDLNPTSSPRPSLSLEAQALSSFTQRRRQRQALVRLQCLAKRAPDIAMLLEECHPSSMPLEGGATWAGSRNNSTTTSVPGYGSNRVDKERVLVRRQPRCRRRTNKS